MQCFPDGADAAMFVCCVCLQVLDRLLLARLLGGLQGLELPAGVRARGSAFCEVQGFDAGTADAVAAAGEQPLGYLRALVLLQGTECATD
jgi:hypothetical protein